MSTASTCERFTPEELELYDAWTAAVGVSDGAYEAVRSAQHRLRDTLEATHLVAHNFETLRRKNAAAREEAIA